MNLKHLMMNGKVLVAVFTVFVVLVIIFAVIIPNMREDSVLGHSNPAKQKLMVIDQDTGAISFVNKSLQGINEDFTGYEGKVLSALKMLLGDNLDGFGGGGGVDYGAMYTAGDKTVGVIDFLVRDVKAAKDLSSYNTTEHRRWIDEIHADVMSFKKLGDHTPDTMADLRLALESGIREFEQVSISHTGKTSSGAWDTPHYLGDDQCDGEYSSEERTRWCKQDAPPAQWIEISKVNG